MFGSINISADNDEPEEIVIPEESDLTQEEKRAVDELISPYIRDFGDDEINNLWRIFLTELG